jgi:DNA-binding beta-propeller fold protein YncE
MRMRVRVVATGFVHCWPLLAAAACGMSGDYAAGGAFADAGTGGGGASDAGPTTCLSSSECPTGYVCNDFGRCEIPRPTGDGGVAPPPEVEYELGAPVSSQRYVYVAVTAQDELARIDGSTLEVVSRPVGDAPRVVGAIPNSDGAVVLDATNGTASIVRPAAGTDTVRVLPTLPHLNRLDLDPSGRFAVIWFDLTKAIQDGGISGIGSFQDVTVVRLAPGGEKAVNLTVGFRPREVEFDAPGNRAYVITEDGVSVIDLAIATTSGPSIVPPIPVADPLTPPTSLEVDIVPSGEYAAVRRAGEPSLRVVVLGNDLPGLPPGHILDIPLASPPTDIDLAPDGTRVYAVEREAKQLAIIDVPGDALDPAGVEVVDLANATVGSLVLSHDGTRALLFTNATLDERLTMVKLDQPGYPTVTWPMKKAARAVGLSPSGTTALVIHAKAPGDPATASSVDEYIDRSYGYSLIDLATGFAKLQITPVDPGPFAYAPDGSKVYVALDGGDAITAPRALQIVQTQTGVVTSKQLGSPPSAVGILPGAGEAFAMQRHPLGRITFVNLVTDAVRTVTGFDLNGSVVN